MVTIIITTIIVQLLSPQFTDYYNPLKRIIRFVDNIPQLLHQFS